MTDTATFVAGQTVDKKDEPAEMVQVMQKRIDDKDTFIETLKTENQKYREMISDLELKQQTGTTVKGALDQLLTQPTESKSSSDTELNEDTIVEKTYQRLQQEEATRKEENNFKEVGEKLTKVFTAEKVDSKIKEVAEKNGLSFEDVVSLAKKSPSAVYRLFDMDTKVSGQPLHGTQTPINTDGTVRDRAWFAQLRRKNPKLYWSEDMQREFRNLFN